MNALLACLNKQNAVLLDFLQTTDEEAEAMQQGQFKRLPTLVQHKAELTTQLAELDRQREQLQQTSGFHPERCADEAVMSAWQLLRERATQARAHNHRNAVTTHTLLNFTRQAIATMQGGGQLLYGSNGKHPSGMGSRKSLGQG
jgi:flagellar biosynthesis/type III secretory pathway chaperone